MRALAHFSMSIYKLVMEGKRMVLVPQFTQKVIESEIIIWEKPPDVQFRRQSINPLTCGLSVYVVVSVNCMNDIIGR